MTDTQLARADMSATDSKMLEAVVVGGDLSRLNPQQRLSWYQMRCNAAGLDPFTQPFEYITLQGKLTLYAKKGAADQIASNRQLSTQIISKEINDYISVQVRVSDPSGRFTEDMGMVPTPAQKGDNYANAVLKAVSKAKRRAILSHCGLGMLDETEVETIPGARIEPHPILVDEPVGPALASSETRDEYEQVRAAANKLGFLTPSGNPVPVLTDEETEPGARKKIAALNKWLSANPSQSAEPEIAEGEVVGLIETNYGQDPEGGLVPVPAYDPEPTVQQREKWAELIALAQTIGITVPSPWPQLITGKDAAERIRNLDEMIEQAEAAA